MKKLIVATIIFFISVQPVDAGRGCCSSHGGQSYCGSNGQWICSDGWESSCTCGGGTYNGGTTYFAPAPKTDVLDSVTGYPTFSSNSDRQTYDVTFDWTDASGATAYSVTMNKIKGGDPGPRSDTYVSSYTFPKMKPGNYYVNIKALVGGYWTNTHYWDVTVPAWQETTAYTFQTTPPEPSPVALTTIDSETTSSEDGVIQLLLISFGILVATVAIAKWGFYKTIMGALMSLYIVPSIAGIALVIGGIGWLATGFIMNIAYSDFEMSKLSVVPFAVAAGVLIVGYGIYVWRSDRSKINKRVLK